jgi:hypothetical protein
MPGGVGRSYRRWRRVPHEENNVARWLRSLVLIGGLAVVGATTYGCSSAATPAAPPSGAAQSSSASQPAVASSSAPAVSSASASVAPPSASAPAGAAGDPTPAATKRYKCSTLISDAEMQSASGYAEAKLFGDDQSGSLSGQTYCSFFTGNAGISIAVSVFTAGDGWDKAFLPLWKLGQVTPGAIHLDGIGDGAIYGATTHAGLALVAGHGVSVIFSDMATGKLKGVDLKAQITKILQTVVGRV